MASGVGVRMAGDDGDHVAPVQHMSCHATCTPLVLRHIAGWPDAFDAAPRFAELRVSEIAICMREQSVTVVHPRRGDYATAWLETDRPISDQVFVSMFT
jgi:hypothetical protein